MASFRGTLDQSRPYQGIEVVLYSDNNIRIDVDVTDEFGDYFFTDIDPGNYQVRLFGGNYTERDWFEITIVDDRSLDVFYIKPLNGTVIKNNTGQLSFEIVGLTDAGVQQVLTQGDVKFYTRSGGNYVQVLSGDPGVVSTDGYTLTVNQSFLSGTETLYAYNGVNEYDHITIADVSDGVGFVAWVEASSYVTIYNPETDTYSPTTITMTPKFAVDGDILTLPDGNFTFETLPTAGGGITVNSSTGVVTVDTTTYFDTSDTYTPS